MFDRSGQQLGNYRLLRQLGQGGFGQVYLGEQIYLKTHAAIKLLLEDGDEAQAAAFRTAFATRRAAWAGIIRHYSSGNRRRGT